MSEENKQQNTKAMQYDTMLAAIIDKHLSICYNCERARKLANDLKHGGVNPEHIEMEVLNTLCDELLICLY
jgi:hypothetical protein